MEVAPPPVGQGRQRRQHLQMIPQQDDEDGAGRATIAARTATASAIIATMVGLAVGLGKFVRVLHGQLVGCLQLNALNMCLQQLALCRVASAKGPIGN